MLVCFLLGAVACTPGGTTEPIDAFAASPRTQARSIRIQGVEATQPPVWRADGRRWGLTLRWDPPTDIDVVDYEIRRDGETLQTGVEGAAYRDNSAEPGMVYRYTVIGIDTLGRNTKAGTALVRTGEPKLRGARVDGTFLMRMHLVSSFGLASPAHGGGVMFRFDPVCRKGPCAVTWSTHPGAVSGRLPQAGRTYSATAGGRFLLRSCHGGMLDERLNVSLHVTDAAVMADAWRATRLSGTLTESASAKGCVPAGIRWTLRGSIQT